MTPALALRAAIKTLPVKTPIAGRWPASKGSTSHREHWTGWLAGYDGPGYYNRRVPKAAGVPTGAVREADAVMRRLTKAGVSDSDPRTGIAVRKVLPWALVEAALGARI
jgi:hypothetical protein